MHGPKFAGTPRQCEILDSEITLGSSTISTYQKTLGHLRRCVTESPQDSIAQGFIVNRIYVKKISENFNSVGERVKRQIVVVLFQAASPCLLRVVMNLARKCPGRLYVCSQNFMPATRNLAMYESFLEYSSSLSLSKAGCTDFNTTKLVDDHLKLMTSF